MSSEQCKCWENCDAPLCPLDERSLGRGIWYADEVICQLRKFHTLPWVRKQKRIAKAGLNDDGSFFTVSMLESIAAVTKGLKGADPDDIDSEGKWLKHRAEKRLAASEKRGNRKGTNEKKLVTLAL